MFMQTKNTTDGLNRPIDLLVVGAGPAGAMAAYAAAARGLRVCVVEKNRKIGKKLFLTGKGRCNLTNSRPIADFFSQIIRNDKFMRSAFYALSNEDLLSLLGRYGLQTKTERGGRVFPVSDHSSDVIKTLERMLREEGAHIEFGFDVAEIQKNETGFTIRSKDGREAAAPSLLLATGGLSYPSTGSDGAGYRFAERLGHTVAPPRPALVGLKSPDCRGLQGLTLKNVLFTLYQKEKKIYAEQGELLFTHDGVSGPVVLSASCFIDDCNPPELRAEIDLKPALDAKTLDARLVRELSGNKGKQLKTVLLSLMPARLVPYFLEQSGVDGGMVAGQVTKETRKALARTLKGLCAAITGTGSIGEAVITAGGVTVKEVNPSTMESKKTPGLYLAGELLDVHALTGGYNLQIAFSTGYLAGSSAPLR